ncbi:MAG: TadE/TadG family type IV pilus assembly protein [Elusimicrobiota bacterium]
MVWRSVRAPKFSGAQEGQVLVEVLLILPIFLFLMFMIMEIGFLAFQTILLHHAAYEAARIASLTAKSTPSASCAVPSLDPAKAQQVVAQMFKAPTPAFASVQGPIPTLLDPQEGCMNYDVQVEVRRVVPMVFPMTGVVLADQPGKKARLLRAIVRMPIERPLFK